MSIVRTVRLTERRTSIRRVPRKDVDELLRGYSRVIDVVPTMDRGWYRLMPRGVVGSFRTTTRLWEVRPKLGWESIRYLLDTDRCDSAGKATPDIASAFAIRLAELMLERATVGLVRDYVELDTCADSIHGRIDLPRQLRDARSMPGRFHLRVDRLTSDVIWNQIPVAVVAVLESVPGLTPAARTALTRARVAFAGITPRPFSLDDIDTLTFDARTASYRSLIAWCRTVRASHAGDCLLSLDHLFPAHVTRLLTTGRMTRHMISPSMPIRFASTNGMSAPLVLIPDVTVADSAGRATAVWDIKWKNLDPTGPESRDLQQVLGYAAALGVQYAGLVYPGRRFSFRAFEAEHSVRVVVLTHRLTGTSSQRSRASLRLLRTICRPEWLFTR